MKKFYDDYTGYQLMSSSGIEVHLYKNSDLEEVETHRHDFLKYIVFWKEKYVLKLIGIVINYVRKIFV